MNKKQPLFSWCSLVFATHIAPAAMANEPPRKIKKFYEEAGFVELKPARKKVIELLDYVASDRDDTQVFLLPVFIWTTHARAFVATTPRALQLIEMAIEHGHFLANRKGRCTHEEVELLENVKSWLQNSKK